MGRSKRNKKNKKNKTIKTKVYDSEYRSTYFKIKKEKMEPQVNQTNDSISINRNKEKSGGIVDIDGELVSKSPEYMWHFEHNKTRYTICAKIVHKSNKKLLNFGFCRMTPSEKRNWSRKLSNKISRGRAIKRPGFSIQVKDNFKLHDIKTRMLGLFPSKSQAASDINNFFKHKEEQHQINVKMKRDDMIFARTKRDVKYLLALHNNNKEKLIESLDLK